MSYKLLLNGVLRLSDGATIPDSIDNRDWKEYQEWLKTEGNIPAPRQSLPEAVSERKQAVNALREQKLVKGFTWNGHLWDSDDRGRANIAGILTALVAGLFTAPPGFTWRTKDNGNVAVTDADLKAMGLALFAYANGIYKAAHQHRDALNLLPTVEQVVAYDVDSGW